MWQINMVSTLDFFQVTDLGLCCMVSIVNFGLKGNLRVLGV